MDGPIAHPAKQKRRCNQFHLISFHLKRYFWLKPCKKTYQIITVGAQILQQLVTYGTSEQHMENYTFVQGQLSRKMFGQCLICHLKALRSFGITTIACLRQRTRPLWRACARWLGNKQTRAEAYTLEGVLNAYLCC